MPATIQKSTLQALISRQLGQFIAGTAPRRRTRIFIADTYYLSLEQSEINVDWLLNTIRTDPIISPTLAGSTYKENVFDCDDYALALRNKVALYMLKSGAPYPLALGCLFTRTHAFNILYERRGTLRLIDILHSEDVASTADQTEFAAFLDMTKPKNKIELIYI